MIFRFFFFQIKALLFFRKKPRCSITSLYPVSIPITDPLSWSALALSPAIGITVVVG